jgi:hypothetical protein
MKTKTTIAVLATLLLTLALAPASFAQSGRDGYIEQGPSVIDQTDSGTDPSANAGDPSSGDDTNPSADIADTSGGELPFTGLDLGLIVAAGASLMLLGVGMRRLTRGPDSA